MFLALMLNLTNRDFYLPFLGQMVYPTYLLKQQTPKGSTMKVRVHNVIPNSKILYWASYKNKHDFPWNAYDDYSNSGVALSNKDGIVVVEVKKPVSYKIPSGKLLKPHVHYRETLSDGMLSHVKTFYV